MHGAGALTLDAAGNVETLGATLRETSHANTATMINAHLSLDQIASPRGSATINVAINAMNNAVINATSRATKRSSRAGRCASLAPARARP